MLTMTRSVCCVSLFLKYIYRLNLVVKRSLLQARIQNFLLQESNSDVFFCVVDEGREDPNTTKTGHHRSMMAQH